MLLKQQRAVSFIQSTWTVVVSDKWILSCQDLKLPPAATAYDVTQDAVYLPRRHRCFLDTSSTSELQERSHLQEGAGMIIWGFCQKVDEASFIVLSRVTSPNLSLVTSLRVQC